MATIIIAMIMNMVVWERFDMGISSLFFMVNLYKDNI